MKPGDELVDAESGRRFVLGTRLGAGGFGAVWLASVRSGSGIGHQVAVKLIHADVDADERMQASERLRDEARVLANLRHPVILATHDLVRFGDRLALVTEYVEGEDLGRLFAHPTRPLPLSATLEVVSQVAGALDTAWREFGLVHRDVKPANVRIGRHGNVKLLDFGIARSALLDREADTGNGVVGSARYLAPERFVAGRAPHPGSDVFALGCVLYEGACGQPFFAGMDLAMVCGMSASRTRYETHRNAKLSAPMPEPVRALLADLLAYVPSQRPDAGAVATRCEDLAERVGPSRALARWCRTFPWDGGAVPAATPVGVDTSTTSTAWTPVSAAPPSRPPPRSRAERRRGLVLAGGSLLGLGLVFTVGALRLLTLVLWPGEVSASTSIVGAPPSRVPVLSEIGRVGSPALADPMLAQLEVRTDLPAELHIGGERVGTTPLEVQLTPGTHEVSVVLPDQPETQQRRWIEVRPANHNLLEFVLTPEPPKEVFVVVIARPGELWIDGAFMGPTNERLSLPVGHHRCEVVSAKTRTETACEIRRGTSVLDLR